MGVQHINKICDSVLHDTFDMGKDPLTSVIVKSFLDNEYGSELDMMETDFNYAISQLSRVRDLIKKHLN